MRAHSRNNFQLEYSVFVPLKFDPWSTFILTDSESFTTLTKMTCAGSTQPRRTALVAYRIPEGKVEIRTYVHEATAKNVAAL